MCYAQIDTREVSTGIGRLSICCLFLTVDLLKIRVSVGEKRAQLMGAQASVL